MAIRIYDTFAYFSQTMPLQAKSMPTAKKPKSQSMPKCEADLYFFGLRMVKNVSP